MTLEQIYYLAEIVAAGAVIGSLVFVGTQLRLNTRAVRISAGQAMVSTWAATSRDVLINEDLLRDAARALTGSDGGEAIAQVRVSMWLGNAIRQAEFNYFNWKAGDLDERYWKQTEGALARMLATEMGSAAWDRLRYLHSPEFVRIMDGHVAAAAEAVAPSETPPARQD